MRYKSNKSLLVNVAIGFVGFGVEFLRSSTCAVLVYIGFVWRWRVSAREREMSRGI